MDKPRKRSACRDSTTAWDRMGAKGTHEEHLDVYNFKKKERKKEVQVLKQEKEYLTAENEGLNCQIVEANVNW